MVLRADAAPKTVEHVLQLVEAGLFDGTEFYRSDFVIQFGLHGSGKKNPYPDITENETHVHEFVSNARGTCSVAHWDIPDNGNSELFINLKANEHLDEAGGGYCVFAQVNWKDASSFEVVDKIAEVVAAGTKVKIESVTVR